jgi:hypothetical protein
MPEIAAHECVGEITNSDDIKIATPKSQVGERIENRNE